jgi:hypothetical protein
VRQRLFSVGLVIVSIVVVVPLVMLGETCH